MQDGLHTRESAGGALRVVLVSTAAPDRPGSMRRYAEAVRLAPAAQPGGSRPVLTAVAVAPAQESLQRLPGPLGNWFHHAVCAARLRRAVLGAQPDVVHILDGSHAYLANLLPGRARVVATVHDLIPLLTSRGELPGRHPSTLGHLLWRLSLRGLRRCRRVLADSESTRRDLARLAGLPDEQLVVVPLPLWSPGAGNGPLPTTRGLEAEADPNRRGPPVLLHVGHNGAYKNREGVLRTGALVLREQPVRLVLVGPPPTPALRRLAAELGLAAAAEWSCDVGDAQLQDLYREAAVFLFPSLYEGFGWPPLEAMVAGVPVVCSDAASLPEVVGDAALTAGPCDYAQLARHCLDLLSNPDLRAELVRRGAANTRRFTAERFAADLMAVYHAAAR